MAATMTSCSTAILATKSILQILHYSSEIFTSVFARKFYEQMVILIQKEAWNFTKNKLLKLVNSMKVDFYLPS